MCSRRIQIRTHRYVCNMVPLDHMAFFICMSVMCDAHAITSHQLKLKQQHCLHCILDSLPVLYDCSLKACFSGRVFKNYFFETMHYQMAVMKDIHVKLEDMDA